MKNLLAFMLAPCHRELLFWAAALTAPVFIDPMKPHFSFCLFKNIGIDFCPGCGLGRAMALFYRGDIAGSFLCHPLGIIGVGVILFRIITLIYKAPGLTGLRMGEYHG
ncbi:MAG: DUF2752 domain-containing protein [candidate division Zixibacteria bacterium]|nr:DUF2752 domain-containing protein [candidate division Zixibacteria bacterium]